MRDSENTKGTSADKDSDSRKKIEEALASSTRWKSKEASKELLNMFEGSVIHTIFDTKQVIAFFFSDLKTLNFSSILLYILSKFLLQDV